MSHSARRLPALFDALISNRVAAAALVAGGVIAIGAIDFMSGVELRIFPLYYGPIALAAWSFGHRAAIAVAVASAVGWLVSNQLAGQDYSHPWLWAANTAVQGGSFAIVGLLVASLRLTIQRERALSRTDALSGLMNHRAFYEESERLLGLCRRGRRPITLAYLDLDNFKAVNDHRGHLAGDDLLRAVGEVLTSQLRGSDLTARLGGDEFAVLLPELGPAEAEAALARLRDAINAALARPDVAPPITVSIGAMTMLAAPSDVKTLVHKADGVMYVAKSAGKNQVRVVVEGS